MSRFSKCDRYDPDNVFQRFKVIEFPKSFVGLPTSRSLDVEVDLNKSALLKTLCEGTLMKFEDSRNISPSHRAFNISQLDNHTILITFYPINECICNSKRKNVNDNRFVFDLRLIKVDGVRCCGEEQHSEIGRYYICGEYEYCKLSNFPKIINFDKVLINSKVKKYIHIRNESTCIAAKFEYIRETGFEVSPQTFTIPASSTKRILVTIKPTSLKVNNTIIFKVRNPHMAYVDSFQNDNTKEDPYLTHRISCTFEIIYSKKPIVKEIESLHKLIEKDIKYTYVTDKEKAKHKNIKDIAKKHLEICKSSYVKKPVIEKFCTGRVTCYYVEPVKISTLSKDFCKPIQKQINIFELCYILLLPLNIDFGRIGLMTHGDEQITIKNNTSYDVSIQFRFDEYILYTENKCKSYVINLKSKTQTIVSIFCLGFVEGNFKGTFEYSIDDKYTRKHSYSLQVGNPTLLVNDKNLKFGMTTSDTFVTSVPVRIYNYFNTPVNFNWNELNAETPFEIFPSSGTVPKHSCRICDVMYVCKPSKSKTHEIDFISAGKISKVFPLELSIMSRKLSIKFLQTAVIFKDIPLNIETVERVKLENSSRELAVFYVVEPLIPGITIEPMSGNIRPKMILTFVITVKISCVLEFSFDVYVKINNKENVILPISGNVVEPKIIIQPKNIIMSRIPSNMVTYVPVTFTNLSTLKNVVEVLDTGDENIFDVYIAQGNEKIRTFEFYVDGGQSKTVFIKVYDIFRREYEMYVPFKINGLLGPPNENSWSTELHYYIGQYEERYENNPKVKIRSINKDICYCRISGVITVPWIKFSTEMFEIDYVPNGKNQLEFEMQNISKYYLYVTIVTSKLSPYFTLDYVSENSESTITESSIKFELDRGSKASFVLKFQPKAHGRYVSTAVLFLDKHMTIPYHNLTFIGTRQTPPMIPSCNRIVFPPSYVGIEMTRFITILLKVDTDLDSFSCLSKEEPNLSIKFVKVEAVEEEGKTITKLTVQLGVFCAEPYSRNLTITFQHEGGSSCEVDVFFSFTYCALTLHANTLVKNEDNPYPYYPLSSQTELYEYMQECTIFLEKWMYQQGFRRDLYPVIPDTFHAISTGLSSQSTGTKIKGINVCYLNFVRRVAGPLMKHIHKVTVSGIDDPYKSVQEIHDTYQEIINLLKSRGANTWLLQAKFLLSYEQFVIYVENITTKCNADILLNHELVDNPELFDRLTKQSWIDFILQSYKVFIMDSCFFECVCVSSQNRDIVGILIKWYNDNIMLQHSKLRKKGKPVKVITNLTTDLADGIAIISTFLTNCPFISNHFSLFSEIEGDDKEAVIVNNACLIIEAMNLLRLYFPLSSSDFLEINFLQMFFLSIHLYVTLPMFRPKDTIKFHPPLLKSSSRQVSISPTSQESLIFNFVILNNTKNNFQVEKAPAADNGKKMFINVKYSANFVNQEECVLLVHGYNKTRIFDTYIVFILQGEVGILNPLRKCKVTGPLYRPNKVDILIASPFALPAVYKVYLTDVEPTNPVYFEEKSKPRFYLQRLNLIDKEIYLSGLPKESGQDLTEHKLYLQIICLSTQIGNSWIWFRSELGEFFVKVTTQPRWDLAIDTLQSKVQTWPMDPCSCGESCECYRTTVLLIPHRNELMLKSLRYALLENASETMMNVFDYLIETTTGKMILSMLLAEVGTNMSDVNHILRNEMSYRISSKSLLPRVDRVTLAHHTSAMLTLPVTVPAQDKNEKYTITFTSDCGMDIRTYRIFFIASNDE